jgi:hypothetical protein
MLVKTVVSFDSFPRTDPEDPCSLFPGSDAPVSEFLRRWTPGKCGMAGWRQNRGRDYGQENSLVVNSRCKAETEQPSGYKQALQL